MVDKMRLMLEAVPTECVFRAPLREIAMNNLKDEIILQLPQQTIFEKANLRVRRRRKQKTPNVQMVNRIVKSDQNVLLSARGLLQEIEPKRAPTVATVAKKRNIGILSMSAAYRSVPSAVLQMLLRPDEPARAEKIRKQQTRRRQIEHQKCKCDDSNAADTVKPNKTIGVETNGVETTDCANESKLIGVYCGERVNIVDCAQYPFECTDQSAHFFHRLCRGIDELNESEGWSQIRPNRENKLDGIILLVDLADTEKSWFWDKVGALKNKLEFVRTETVYVTGDDGEYNKFMHVLCIGSEQAVAKLNESNDASRQTTETTETTEIKSSETMKTFGVGRNVRFYWAERALAKQLIPNTWLLTTPSTSAPSKHNVRTMRQLRRQLNKL